MSDGENDQQSFKAAQDVKRPLNQSVFEEDKEETKDEVVVEKEELDGGGRHISGAFEEMKEPMEKETLRENDGTDQPLENKHQVGGSPGMPDLVIGGLPVVRDVIADGNTVVSITSLRRGEQLAHLVPVAPGAVSVFPSTYMLSSESEELQHSSFDDSIPTGDISSDASHQQQQEQHRVPEATVVRERPIVLAVRHTMRDDENTMVSKRFSRCTTGGLMLLLVIGAIVAAVAVKEGNKSANPSSTAGDPVLITLAPSSTPSSAPSTSLGPSLSPSNSFKTAMVELIQSRSPKTHFLSSDAAAAFDWMLSDPYSLTLEGNDDRLAQRFALATLWFAVGLVSSSRKAFEGWMQPTNECDWRGLTTMPSLSCNAHGFVDHINLVENVDPGSIPVELMLLSHLRYLRLNAAPLTGMIPSQLSLLTSLTTLSLWSDALTGTIPSELWFSLTNLEIFEIGSNPEMAPSSIPPEVSSLSQLKILDLEGVPLSGGIPTEVGSLSALTALHLKDCTGLAGRIPTHFGMLSRLSRLEVTGSQLTGPIPTEFGLLYSLRTLILNQNSFTSSIPKEIALLTDLTALHLDSNDGLTGRIPTELASLRALTSLVLGGNDGLLMGRIPTFIDTLSQLSHLHIGGNFSGTVPTEWGSLTTLTRLYLLNCTGLTSSVPTTFGRLTRLSRLEVTGSQLTGPIPTELGLLELLTNLSLGQNSFTSTIPTELGKLTQLYWLSLNGCDGVTGTIPTEIGQLGILEELLLGGNDLTGTVPTEIGLLKSLANLSLSNNRFSGSVPSELASLTLNGLRLETNNLTGSIPDSMCAIADVVVECKEIECSCCICCCE